MTNITIRDIPQEVRDELASRAALEGKSMQDFLRNELIRLASSPSLQAWVNAVQERKSHYRTSVPADEIIAARDADRK